MRIRMIADISGTRNGAPWPPYGQFAELPDQEARELCDLELAEPANGEDEPVTRDSASALTRETATTRRTRKAL
jgi:hypothetical protein